MSNSDTPRIGCPYCDGHYCTEDLRGELAAREAELAGLLTRIQNYDRVIQAVATALGGVCCGGIDVDGPGSTKDALVGAIEKLMEQARQVNRDTEHRKDVRAKLSDIQVGVRILLEDLCSSRTAAEWLKNRNS